MRTSAPFCVGSKLQAASPEPLTIEEFMNHLNSGTNYQSNQRALRNIIEATGRAVDVFIDAGLPFNVDFAATNKETAMMSRGGHLYGVAGDERAEYFTAIANEAGIECLFGTTAEALLFADDGSVAGIQCVSGSDVIDIKAGAIVLATGGFLGNPEKVAEHFAGASIVCMGNELNTGAGIDMAVSAGGQMGKCFSISMNEYGGANTKASPMYSFRPTSGTNEAMRLPVFGGLMVNKQGDRFVNEGVMCEKTMFCCEPLMAALTKAPYYAVESMPAGWLTLGGVKCDENCQVLTADNSPIKGLFVAGADADLFTSPYYAPGSANGFAIGSGLIAGEAAAKAAK